MPETQTAPCQTGEKQKLLILVGPTAVGKTDLSIRLAQRLGAEIISADSRLFYRGMNIGTAKPSLAERAGVPHHLIDIANPDQVLSLAEFQQLAAQAAAEIQSRGRLPILVGGTGQYIRAVVDGWSGPAAPPNPALRQALEAWAEEVSPLGLYQRLALLDPQAAEVIEYQNVRRTIRALEVIFTTGQRFSAQRQTGEQRYQTLTIGLTRPRPELFARVDARIEAMLAAGLVAEVHDLLAAGYDLEASALSAIGYREIGAYLLGQSSLDDAVAQFKHKTHVFVRRQANWFKPTDPQIHWFDASAVTLDAVVQLVRGWL